ncbi:unnamed protein product [Gadus morhua 'NCC']
MAPCCECWGSGAQTAAAAHRVTDWKKLILRSNNNAGVVPRGGGVEWVGRGGGAQSQRGPTTAGPDHRGARPERFCPLNCDALNSTTRACGVFSIFTIPIIYGERPYSPRNPGQENREPEEDLHSYSKVGRSTTTAQREQIVRGSGTCRLRLA